MNADLLRRVRQVRSENPFMPTGISQAVTQARYELNPDLGGYEFLSGLNEYWPTVTGSIGELEITVSVEPDDESRIGEDDVTGTFIDQRREGAIRNTTTGVNGQGYAFYYPASYRMEEAEAGMPWATGLSKARKAEYYRWCIERDMFADASRTYLGVIVTISLDGKELGRSSLWGIDTIDGYEVRPYLIEVAIDNIAEAIDEVKRNADKIVSSAREAVTSAQAHAQRVAEVLAALADN